MNAANENKPLGVTGKCPICSKPADTQYRPFCSRRCADVDLNRWLTGSYAIPVVESEPDDPDEDRLET